MGAPGVRRGRPARHRRGLGLVLAALLLVNAGGAPGAARAHEPEPRGRLVIHATGDVNFSPSQMARFLHDGYAFPWTRLEGIFEGDHLTIVNLECSPSTMGLPRDKPFAFRCPLEALPLMAAAGVEVASLANNHSGDFGPQALLDGIDNLRAVGIHPVGAGADLEEANQPVLFELEGWRVAVLGFSLITGGPGWFATSSRPGVAPATMENITAAVGAAAEVADIVIVTVHWGEEGFLRPTGGDRLRARAMIEAGASVIVGHRPHRLQPLEIVDGVPVFWSLGNFVWPRLSTPGATTAVARVVVHPDGTLEACKIPAFIETHGRPVLTGEPECGP